LLDHSVGAAVAATQTRAGICLPASQLGGSIEYGTDDFAPAEVAGEPVAPRSPLQRINDDRTDRQTVTPRQLAENDGSSAPAAPSA
jgi:hypothetical protein